MKKYALLVFGLLSLLSCSSSDTSGTSNSSNATTAIMTTKIDGYLYDTPPQNGSNIADATGGTFGTGYYLLNGFKNTANGKLTAPKMYYLKIAIPKSNIFVGTHDFTNNIQPDAYFASLTITGNNETVATISGNVKITYYNSTTKEIKGSFTFTTSNGVDVTTVTHNVIGTFDFFLQ